MEMESRGKQTITRMYREHELAGRPHSDGCRAEGVGGLRWQAAEEGAGRWAAEESEGGVRVRVEARGG